MTGLERALETIDFYLKTEELTGAADEPHRVLLAVDSLFLDFYKIDV